MTMPSLLDELASVAAVSPETGGEAGLAERLYSLLHCRRPVDWSPDDQPADWIGEKDFARRLSRANHGTGTWQAGWTVAAIAGDGSVEVERYGVRFRASAGAVRSGSGELSPGAPARVRVARELRELLGGFYTALGNAEEPEGAGLRIYWNLYSAGGPLLVERLTSRLNAAGIPFWLKVLKDPAHYGRTDSAVLYLPREVYPAAAPLLAEIRLALAPYLKAPVSAYVRRLAPGIGLAEDPVPDESFGQHRSRLLAGLMYSEPSLAAETIAGRMRVLIDGIAAAGLDAGHFHLAPGSSAEYPAWDA